MDSDTDDSDMDMDLQLHIPSMGRLRQDSRRYDEVNYFDDSVKVK